MPARIDFIRAILVDLRADSDQAPRYQQAANYEEHVSNFAYLPMIHSIK